MTSTDDLKKKIGGSISFLKDKVNESKEKFSVSVWKYIKWGLKKIFLKSLVCVE